MNGQGTDYGMHRKATVHRTMALGSRGVYWIVTSWIPCLLCYLSHRRHCIKLPHPGISPVTFLPAISLRCLLPLFQHCLLLREPTNSPSFRISPSESCQSSFSCCRSPLCSLSLSLSFSLSLSLSAFFLAILVH